MPFYSSADTQIEKWKYQNILPKRRLLFPDLWILFSRKDICNTFMTRLSVECQFGLHILKFVLFKLIVEYTWSNNVRRLWSILEAARCLWETEQIGQEGFDQCNPKCRRVLSSLFDAKFVTTDYSDTATFRTGMSCPFELSHHDWFDMTTIG